MNYRFGSKPRIWFANGEWRCTSTGPSLTGKFFSCTGANFHAAYLNWLQQIKPLHCNADEG